MALETLNGRAVSWAEIEATANIDGGGVLEDIDFKSIDVGSEVKRGQQKKGGRVVAQTTGEVTETGTTTMYRNAVRALKRKLVPLAPRNAKGQAQLSKVRFNLVINHSFEDDETNDIYTIKMNNCHFDSNMFKFAEGVDADVVDVALNPTEIVEIIDGVETVLL